MTHTNFPCFDMSLLCSGPCVRTFTHGLEKFGSSDCSGRGVLGCPVLRNKDVRKT